MKLHYNYCPNTKVFLSKNESLIDPLERTYILPKHATFTAPLLYDPQKEFLVYDPPVDHWRVHKYIPSGTYYLKSNAIELVVTPKNAELSLAMQPKMHDYTNVKPKLPREAATEIHFVDGVWVYKTVNRDFLLSYQVRELKKECSKRIRSYGGSDISDIEWVYKSQNFQDIRATYLSEQGAIANGVEGVKLSYLKEQYDEATRVINRKETLRKKYQAVKKLLQSMGVPELQEFNPADEKHW